MSSEQWVLAGAGLCFVSGLPGLLLGRQQTLGQKLACVLHTLGCLAGLGGAGLYFASGSSGEWPSPIAGAEFSVSVDAISALFLLPLLLVTMLGSIYGLAYWKQTEHPENGRKVAMFYGLLTAAMTLLVIARDGVMFLSAWETMAISAFFLVGTEDQDQETREAAWLYLAASHFATLCLFGLFALMAMVHGHFGFGPLDGAAPGVCLALFILALLGFGTKAGIMPLHIWLPSAHAMAPSHVSAVLSGVMIKMGIYGLVRVCLLLPTPPTWWGGLLLGLGIVSGVLGVAFAVGQHDIKRLLAYHSIENIGIIVMGLGLAMLGRSVGRPDWIVLGMAGALLHVWNHALFKSLLFFSAGSVIHAVKTREIDRLGGLSKAMPYTSICFLIGAVAICGLPPLNGFVSELLIYLGTFRTLGIGDGISWPLAAIGAPALALIGGLAVACFVKVYGAVFLGAGRSEATQHAHESSNSMVGPMIVLAAFCVAIGLAPSAFMPLIERGVLTWGAGAIGPDTTLANLVPLGMISVAAIALLALLLGGSLFLWLRLRSSEVTTSVTWDCGYAAPSSRMQYTSSSFAQMLVHMFTWALRPKTHAPHIHELFPPPADFHSEVDDTVLEEAVLPSARFVTWLFSWAKYLQQGSIQVYLLYILVILTILLLWR